jgi:hypothetical protein
MLTDDRMCYLCGGWCPRCGHECVDARPIQCAPGLVGELAVHCDAVHGSVGMRCRRTDCPVSHTCTLYGQPEPINPPPGRVMVNPVDPTQWICTVPPIDPETERQVLDALRSLGWYEWAQAAPGPASDSGDKA